MFKSIINTFNGHSKGHPLANEAGKQQQAAELRESNVADGSEVEEPIVTKQSSAKQQSSKQKSGRKKLSAMMGKIQSSIQHNGFTSKGSAKHQTETNNNNGSLDADSQVSYDEDEDDDDQDVYDDSRSNPDELINSMKSIEVGDSDAATASAKSAYKKGDKFILPEEQCDIPTFLHTQNCDQHLIDETRRLLRERYAKNPENFYDSDFKRMLTDDWTVSRFLLRRRLEPKRTAKLMEECGRFRKQYKMSEVKLWEFPIEFHKAGGLFKYAPDRVGNMTVYMRVKMYRRVPEISDVFKAWILCVLEECDMANGGRGTAVIFDLTGCGLQNVDLGFLSWLLSSFRNYCPKGVSYILVYNLPWILNATCKLAMTWMSASNRRALRFVYGDEIENFIARENLPDYCGGTCKLDYRKVPDGSLPATEVCDRLDMTPEQALKIRDLFKEYLSSDDESEADDEKGAQKK